MAFVSVSHAELLTVMAPARKRLEKAAAQIRQSSGSTARSQRRESPSATLCQTSAAAPAAAQSQP